MELRHEALPPWALPLLLGWALLGIVLFLALPIFRSGTDPESAVAKAVERTSALSGARISFEGGVSSVEGSASMSGSGVLNNETDRALIRATFGADSGSGEFTGVTDGLDSYIRSPDISADVGTDLPWILVRAAPLLEEARRQGNYGSAAGVSSLVSDPADLLKALFSLDDELKEVGSEQVGGVPATRYSATIDFESYREQVEAGQSDPSLDALMSSVQGTDADRQVDVWIDDARGVILRERIGTDEALEDNEVTWDFSDFGIRPKVDLPPSSKVFDATSIFLEEIQDSLQQQEG